MTLPVRFVLGVAALTGFFVAFGRLVGHDALPLPLATVILVVFAAQWRDEGKRWPIIWLSAGGVVLASVLALVIDRP